MENPLYWRRNVVPCESRFALRTSQADGSGGLLGTAGPRVEGVVGIIVLATWADERAIENGETPARLPL